MLKAFEGGLWLQVLQSQEQLVHLDRLKNGRREAGFEAMANPQKSSD